MKKEDKGIVVERLAETLKAYGNFYLTDIEALDAEKTSALRRVCYKENVKLVVVKNTLFKKALESMDTDYSALYETLKGNTAVMFSNVVNAPARLMKDFTKGMKGEVKPQLKAACRPRHPHKRRAAPLGSGAPGSGGFFSADGSRRACGPFSRPSPAGSPRSPGRPASRSARARQFLCQSYP